MEMLIIDNERYLPVLALNPRDAALALGFTKKTSYRGVLRWLDKNGVKTIVINGENRVPVDAIKKKMEELSK